MRSRSDAAERLIALHNACLVHSCSARQTIRLANPSQVPLDASEYLLVLPSIRHRLLCRTGNSIGERIRCTFEITACSTVDERPLVSRLPPSMDHRDCRIRHITPPVTPPGLETKSTNAHASEMPSTAGDFDLITRWNVVSVPGSTRALHFDAASILCVTPTTINDDAFGRNSFHHCS